MPDPTEQPAGLMSGLISLHVEATVTHPDGTTDEEGADQ